MSEYLITIYEEEAGWAGADQGTWDEVMKGHNDFGQANESALRGGNALQPTSTATSTRKDASGRFLVTDGPFVETNTAHTIRIFPANVTERTETATSGRRRPEPPPGFPGRPRTGGPRADPGIHDLENVGDSTICYSTVEWL
jgi:hypothetical protein